MFETTQTEKVEYFIMGKPCEWVQVKGMSSTPEPTKLAVCMAEEVLRVIYGDDYTGCNVSPAAIATVIQNGLQSRDTSQQDLIGLYEKVVEAIHLLSTPPDGSKVTESNELNQLLSQRLDGIHAITSKTIKTTALVRPQSDPG